MQGLAISVGVLVIVYVVAVTALFLSQRLFVFRPDRAPPDIGRVSVPDLTSISVLTADGLSLLAWFLPAARDSSPTVLYLHGSAGNIGHRAKRLNAFRRLGWGVLLLEYRGFGGNPGCPSEAGLLADARGGLAALRTMRVSPDRILLWGESLGSGVAVRLASEQTVAAVLLEAPYTSVTNIARARFPFVPVSWLLLDRFDTLRCIERVRAPVMVMHGTRDRTVPVAMGRAVYEAAPHLKELWIVPGAGHSNLVEAGAIEAAGDFVDRLNRFAQTNEVSDAPSPELSMAA